MKIQLRSHSGAVHFDEVSGVPEPPKLYSTPRCATIFLRFTHSVNLFCPRCRACRSRLIVTTVQPTPEWNTPSRPGGTYREQGNVPSALRETFKELIIEVEPSPIQASAAPKPYPSLTHYTSMAGLEGIIRSRSLRATADEYLNDTTEGVYGVGLLGRAVTELESSLHFSSSSHRYFLSKLRTALDEQQSRLIKDRAPGQRDLSHTCVACFTKEPDQLSQWRGYANGVGGVSVTFPPQSVAALAETPDWRLIECDYSDRMDPQPIIPLLLKLYKFWDKNVLEPTQDHIAEASAALLGGAASDYSAQFKHPKFAEEAEWRLVSTQPRPYTTLDYRVGDFSLVPYATLPLSLPSLEDSADSVGTLGIVCGPNPLPLATRKAIQGYMWSKRIAADVTNSDIPFR